MPKNILNIVDEQDNIIGEESRENIHKKGLLHREIHVYFVTPDKKVILQHRAKDKDTCPDMLDAAVGGHVELGETYLEAAIKETREETGLEVSKDDLIEMAKLSTRSEDTKTGLINHSMKTEYLYMFKGDISDLKIEEGKALGFETWSIEDMINLGDAQKERFISYCYEFIVGDVYNYLKDKE